MAKTFRSCSRHMSRGIVHGCVVSSTFVNVQPSAALRSLYKRGALIILISPSGSAAMQTCTVPDLRLFP